MPENECLSHRKLCTRLSLGRRVDSKENATEQHIYKRICECNVGVGGCSNHPLVF